METSNEIDRATIAICDGKPLLARWSYTLDTSNDDNYPCISYGQLLLRGDGVVFQRVLHSGPEEFGPWDIAPRARVGGPVTDVGRTYSASGGNYAVERIAEPAAARSEPLGRHTLPLDAVSVAVPSPRARVRRLRPLRELLAFAQAR